MSTEEVDLVWREIGRIGTCMMVTHDGTGMRARPMLGAADRAGNRIWFVADRSHHEDQEIATDPRVCLTYADPGQNTFVALSGRAEVLVDRERLRSLWTSTIDGWFEDGPDDPDAMLIAVTPDAAEVWDRPNADIMTALGMLTASEPEEAPKIGDNHKVEM